MSAAFGGMEMDAGSATADANSHTLHLFKLHKSANHVSHPVMSNTASFRRSSCSSGPFALRLLWHSHPSRSTVLHGGGGPELTFDAWHDEVDHTGDMAQCCEVVVVVSKLRDAAGCLAKPVMLAPSAFPALQHESFFPARPHARHSQPHPHELQALPHLHEAQEVKTMETRIWLWPVAGTRYFFPSPYDVVAVLRAQLEPLPVISDAVGWLRT
mmetsp:Transcript_30096/g.70883  ORF Transcript_30096/g.70883 Transcript_30096/m.70883 type:complete len:213 (+) Transcript_30096:56-694(+)